MRIEPHQSITIKGWQVATDRLRRFVCASEESSYAKKLGNGAHLGSISVVMFRERTKELSDSIHPKAIGHSRGNVGPSAGSSSGLGTPPMPFIEKATTKKSAATAIV
jgi:hypothetical protein